MIKYLFIALAGLLLLSGCFKSEDPIPPNPVGPIEEVVIPMTEYYVNQVYFELNTGEQVSMNDKSMFDLSFAAADTATLIRLNTAIFMEAAETTETDISAAIDTAGLVWHFDKSDGNPDSTALINWIRIDGTDTIISKNVWLINLGITNQGFPVGMVKVKFHSLKNNTYHFSYADVKDSPVREAFIKKDPGHNYVQFKFNEEEDIRQVEPETAIWDLLFTQYTTLLYTDEGEAYPYLVTGTLINEKGTLVAFDSTMVFEDIVVEDALTMNFQDQLDIIGYDWKALVGDPTGGGDFYYQAQSHWNYIIRSKEGIFYKLRFTGFYDQDTGEKGYPTFEFQRL